MSFRRVALYGGSFNPIHLGHLIIAQSAAEQLGLDRVIFLPSANPPHKAAGDLAPAEHRAAMVKLAIADEPNFEFSDYDMTRPGPTYTIETVAHFQELLGGYQGTKASSGKGASCSTLQLYWIIGADSLMELPTWHRHGELVEMCQIVTAARPGYDVIDWHKLGQTFSPAHIEKLQQGVIETPRIDISSTEIRERVRTGKSIRFFVCESVAAYIHSNGMYR